MNQSVLGDILRFTKYDSKNISRENKLNVQETGLQNYNTYEILV